MPLHFSNRDGRKKLAPPQMRRLFQLRYFEYALFILALFLKLRYLHNNLKVSNIDMNRLDNVIAVGSIMLASFWIFWLYGRARTIALLLLNVLLSGLIFADLIYYRYFQDFITIPVLLQAGQVGELGESIMSLIARSDLWLAADIITWLVVLIGLAAMQHYASRRRKVRTAPSPQDAGPGHAWMAFDELEAPHALPNSTDGPVFPKAGKRPLRRLLTGFLAFIIGYVMTMGPINHYKNTWAGNLFVGNWWNLSLYNITGLLGFHYYDGYRYAKERLSSKPALTREESAEIEGWFLDAAERRNQPNATFGAYKESNIIVVQVEAFMNFMIGKKIGNEEITPHFNRLMEESLYFPNFYHQTGQGRTSDADFSSNSSLHPLPTGSVFVRYPHHEYDVLPQILGQHGYKTAAFHAYEGSFWNRNIMYEAMGYDRFYSKKHYVMDEALGWSLGDKSFFRQSLEFMTGDHDQHRNKPFYSFLITLTSHHPYQLPASVSKLDAGKFKGSIFGNYLESVHYVDAALGQLVEGMKQKGLWDNTILYVYGDHDNSLRDKQDYERFLKKTLSDLDMHQIMNQVPLLIHLPNGTEAGVYDQPAGQLDMAPSLLHLLGISTESYRMMGHNLFGDGERFVVLRSGAFTDGQVYYIPSADLEFSNGQCYSLDTRELVNTEICRPGYNEAKLRLSISDRVITNNLIPQFR